MTDERIVTENIREFNIASPEDEPIFVRERPMESIVRRMEELSLTVETVADLLEFNVEKLREILGEADHCPDELFNLLLYLLGLEIVAVPSNYGWQASDGHWFFRERCVYCGGNVYDVGMYGPAECTKA